MTREHLGVVLALNIPVFCVVTKIDLCPTNVLKRTRNQVFKLFKNSGTIGKKLPMNVRTEEDIETLFSTGSSKLVPIFWVSCVTGQNMPLLLKYISRLQPSTNWRKHDREHCEFNIDQTFSVPGVGTVVSGMVSAGTLVLGSTMSMGPLTDGSFIPVVIKSIHYKRVAVNECRSGEMCAVSMRSLKKKRPIVREEIRRGMAIIDPQNALTPVRNFEAEVLVLHHPTTIKLSYQVT